jgi:hypothetical protein
MRRGGAVAWAVLGLVGLAATVCAPPPEAAPMRPAGDWEALPAPETRLGLEDEIEAVDLVVDAAGTLHASWTEVDRPSGGGSPLRRTLHAFLRRGAAAWSPPREVPVGGAGRLVAGAETLLALGGDLRPFRWAQEGRWEELPASFLDRPAERLLAYDVEALASGIATVFVTSAGQGAPLVLSFSRSGGAPPRPLTTAPASVFEQPPPHLLLDGGRLHLLWGIAGEERGRSPEGAETVTPRGSVVYLSSDDGGTTWSDPVELTARLAERPSGIAGVALVRGAGAPIAVYASFGLYAGRTSPEGGPAVTPVRLTSRPGSFAGTAVGSLTSAGGAVAWVDERLRQTDRRWWRPLGGWPWSDDPDWADNDVFFLSAESLRDALAGSRQRDAAAERLTPDLSFTGPMRLAAGADRLYLLRAGRLEVGKRRDSRGSPPRLFVHARAGGG